MIELPVQDVQVLAQCLENEIKRVQNNLHPDLNEQRLTQLAQDLEFKILAELQRIREQHGGQ